LVPGAFNALTLVDAAPLLLDVLPVLVPAALSALMLVDAAPPPALLSPVLAPGALSACPVVVTIGALEPSPVCVATLAAGLAGLAPPTVTSACGSGLTLAVTPLAPPMLMVLVRVANSAHLLRRGLGLDAVLAGARDGLVTLVFEAFAAIAGSVGTLLTMPGELSSAVHPRAAPLPKSTPPEEIAASEKACRHLHRWCRCHAADAQPAAAAGTDAADTPPMPPNGPANATDRTARTYHRTPPTVPPTLSEMPPRHAGVHRGQTQRGQTRASRNEFE
jgi:hypothetical protein